MKTILSLVLVVLMAGACMAQPPWAGQGKFGMGQGKFGDPAKAAEMRQKIMERWQTEKPKVDKYPGPPPWVGQGKKMSGQRGPQPPFQFEGCFGPKDPRTDLRRGGKNHEVSGHNPHHRGQGWKSRGPVGPPKGRGFKGGKLEGNNKGLTIIIKIEQ